MKMKRRLAILTGLFMTGAIISGCGSSSDSKRKINNNSTSGNSFKSVFDINDDDDDDDDKKVSDASKINFHVGADFNNLVNGGLITENDNYVFFNDNHIYRHDKNSGENMILSFDDGKFLNVSNDGYLYLVRNDGPSYGPKDAIYKINTETGNEELFINTADYLQNNYYFNSSISDVEIRYMVLAENKLFIKADILCFHAEDYCCFFTIDINNKSFTLLQIFSEIGYREGLSVNMCAFAAYDDELYYAYKEGEMGSLNIMSYNPITGNTRLLPFETSGGKSINNGRKSSVDGYDENGNLVRGLYDDYDIEFFDCASDSEILCFSDKHPFAYDFISGTGAEYDNVLHEIYASDEWITIIGKAFHDKKYYFLDSEKGVLWLSDDFSNSGVLYVPDDISDYGDYSGHGGVQKCGFGYVDECLWLIPVNSTESTIVKLSFDGDVEKINFQDAKNIFDPNDIICKGEVVGIKSNGIMMGALMYDSMNDNSSDYISPGTELIIHAKIHNGYNKQTDKKEAFYKVELEDGRIGFIASSFIKAEREPNEILDISDLEETPETTVSYISPSENVTEESKETNSSSQKITGLVVTENDALNVRSGPSTENKKIGSVDKGSSVTIISKENDWYLIEYNGGTGYVSAEYISTDN